MTSIFDNAKFGDKFVTRDGRPAIYGTNYTGCHYLMIKGSPFIYEYNDYGKISDETDDDADIISKYRKDEKEIDKMLSEFLIDCVYQGYDYFSARVGFLEGIKHI